MVILRVIAILIGLLLVLGGGVCTLVGVPVGLMSLFSGGIQILLFTAVGFGLLLVGLRLLKFGGGKKSKESVEPPKLNQLNPEAYIGKYFLIVVNSTGSDKQPLDALQMHGNAEELTEGGVRVALIGRCKGQSWTVPLASIRPAQPGSFTIHATGEVVKDPDFFAHMKATHEAHTIPAAL